jgi:hypothetical protein
VAGYGGSVQEKLVQHCKSLEKELHCFANEVSPLCPSLFEVTQVNKALSKLIVIAPPDKNSGLPDLFCLKTAWNFMFSHYWNKPQHYQKTTFSIESVLSNFLSKYHKHNWVRFGNFNHKGAIPYPYIVRKFKDVTRIRGITSYFLHPLKNILFVSASAFMTCLKHLDFEHSNMFAPNELKATVNKAFKDLRQVLRDDTSFISWGRCERDV